MSYPNEEENKKWLACVRDWVEREKQDSSSTLFASEGCPILEEFKQQEKELVEYLMALDEWLKKYGIKEALKELPSVGMLLSQLCKVQLVLISDCVSAALISCIIHLSDLLHGTKTENKASKRAKNWAVDHLSKMVSVDVDGLDMFLMEEFGISPEEYLREHIHQSSVQLQETLQHPNFVNKDQTSIDTAFSFSQLANNELLVPVFEGMICIDTSKGLSIKGRDSLSESQYIWISENRTLIERISTECLHRLFKRSIASFENFVIDIIKKIIESYPGTHAEIIKQCIEESRLIDLCSLDIRYYLAVLQIIKDSFLIIGPHHGIIQFFRTFMKMFEQLKLTVNTEQVNVRIFTKCHSLGNSFVKSPNGLSVELREEYLGKLEDTFSNNCLADTDEKEVEQEFEIWWCNLQYIDWVDEAILLLYKGSKQNVSICIQLFIRFFHPTEYNGMVAHLQPLTSYVYALRNLLQKNYIQLTDMEFLSSSLRRKVPDGDMDCITSLLTILNVMFIAKSCAAGPVGDRCLKNILDGDDDAVYWFLYTVQLLLQSTHPQTIFKNPSFKDTITNRLDALCTQENDGDLLNDAEGDLFNTADGDILKTADGDKEQRTSTNVKHNIYIVCGKIKKDLDGS